MCDYSSSNVWNKLMNHSPNKLGFSLWRKTFLNGQETFSRISLHHTWGYPHSWMVYIMENPIYKWMIGGYPYFRKPPFSAQLIRCFVPAAYPPRTGATATGR